MKLRLSSDTRSLCFTALPLALAVGLTLGLAHCDDLARTEESDFDRAGPLANDAGAIATDATTAIDATTSPGFGGGDCDAGDACPEASTTVVCGDGRLDSTESCDDGNPVGTDGCSVTCTVEPGWICPSIGSRCVAARCGDGVVAGNEECDHPSSGNVAGCSATCKIEDGFDCDPTTLVCARTVCGDRVVSRGESCDDGNSIPFDGCDSCRVEPSCTTGPCQPSCGDGQRFGGEECDDGNLRGGDGCGSDCKVERGFTCQDVTLAPADSVLLPVIARDLIGVGNALDGGVPHPDFNGLVADGILSIVENDLGPDGRPVYACPDGGTGRDAGGDASPCSGNPGHNVTYGGRPLMTTPANFAQWFKDVPNVTAPVVSRIQLARGLDGTYSWDSGDPQVNQGQTFFDPIRDGGWVGAGLERLVCNPARNVSFTSETHFWFEYDGGERFDFSGDDDTWVFVNGRLAIDLGGLHGKKAGHFVLGGGRDAGPADGTAKVVTDLEPTESTKDLGLRAGQVYELVMFQAERNQCGSNFKVTLKGFNKPKSTCASRCGDGVTASDEVCDDGANNDGAYGHCLPGCQRRGPRCGDGRMDSPFEECDDGNTDNFDRCTNGCVIPKAR